MQQLSQRLGTETPSMFYNIKKSNFCVKSLGTFYDRGLVLYLTRTGPIAAATSSEKEFTGCCQDPCIRTATVSQQTPLPMRETQGWWHRRARCCT